MSRAAAAAAAVVVAADAAVCAETAARIDERTKGRSGMRALPLLERREGAAIQKEGASVKERECRKGCEDERDADKK